MSMSEYFSEMIEEHNLPIPPVPVSMVEQLEQVGEAFFVTNTNDSRIDCFTMSPPYDFKDFAIFFSPTASFKENIDNESIDDKNINGENRDNENIDKKDTNNEKSEQLTDNFIGVGLIGYGLQSWRFCYILEVAHIRILLSFPWTVLGDKKMEYSTLEQAFQLVALCQSNASEEAQLDVILDNSACLWRSNAGKEDMLCSGNDVSSLLDYLEVEDVRTLGLNPHQWIRV